MLGCTQPWRELEESSRQKAEQVQSHWGGHFSIWPTVSWIWGHLLLNFRFIFGLIFLQRSKEAFGLGSYSELESVFSSASNILWPMVKLFNLSWPLFSDLWHESNGWVNIPSARGDTQWYVSEDSLQTEQRQCSSSWAINFTKGLGKIICE